MNNRRRQRASHHCEWSRAPAGASLAGVGRLAQLRGGRPMRKTIPTVVAVSFALAATAATAAGSQPPPDRLAGRRADDEPAAVGSGGREEGVALLPDRGVSQAQAPAPGRRPFRDAGSARQRQVQRPRRRGPLTTVPRACPPFDSCAQQVRSGENADPLASPRKAPTAERTVDPAGTSRRACPNHLVREHLASGQNSQSFRMYR